MPSVHLLINRDAHLKLDLSRDQHVRIEDGNL